MKQVFQITFHWNWQRKAKTYIDRTSSDEWHFSITKRISTVNNSHLFKFQIFTFTKIQIFQYKISSLRYVRTHKKETESLRKEKWTHKIYLSIYFGCFIECIHAKWSVRFNSNTFLHALIVQCYYIVCIWKKSVFSLLLTCFYICIACEPITEWTKPIDVAHAQNRFYKMQVNNISKYHWKQNLYQATSIYLKCRSVRQITWKIWLSVDIDNIQNTRCFELVDT